METRFSYHFPPHTEDVLDNGIRLIQIPGREYPVILAAVQFPVGRFSDPAGREGVADLTLGLIQKGPESISSERFMDLLEHGGASLFGDVSDEHCTIGIRMLASNASEIFPRFWEAISCPSCDKRELSRIKRELLTGLQAEFSDPGALANRHFNAELYGEKHPAGKAQTLGSVKKIRLSDVYAFYERHISPAGAACVIAGDLPGKETLQSWRAMIGEWRAEAQESGAARETVSLESTRVRIVEKNDLSQTTLIIGQPTIGELDPRRSALSIGNYILGGGSFSSRLMKRIRSEAGQTYGVSSQLYCGKESGVFMISTTTQSHQLAEVIKAVQEEFAAMMREGITEDELDKARQFAIGHLAFELEGMANVADKLLWLRHNGRDNSFIERFGERIGALSARDINEAMQACLHGSRFVYCAVGKKDEIAPVLESVGPVRIVDSRSVP